jgi:hypothetical protein
MLQQTVISSINSFKLLISHLYTSLFTQLNTEKSGEQIILKPITIIYAAFRIIKEQLLYSCMDVNACSPLTTLWHVSTAI